MRAFAKCKRKRSRSAKHKCATYCTKQVNTFNLNARHQCAKCNRTCGQMRAQAWALGVTRRPLSWMPGAKVHNTHASVRKRSAAWTSAAHVQGATTASHPSLTIMNSFGIVIELTWNYVGCNYHEVFWNSPSEMALSFIVLAILTEYIWTNIKIMELWQV